MHGKIGHETWTPESGYHGETTNKRRRHHGTSTLTQLIQDFESQKKPRPDLKVDSVCLSTQYQDLDETKNKSKLVTKWDLKLKTYMLMHQLPPASKEQQTRMKTVMDDLESLAKPVSRCIDEKESKVSIEDQELTEMEKAAKSVLQYEQFDTSVYSNYVSEDPILQSHTEVSLARRARTNQSQVYSH